MDKISPDTHFIISEKKYNVDIDEELTKHFIQKLFIRRCWGSI